MNGTLSSRASRSHLRLAAIALSALTSAAHADDSAANPDDPPVTPYRPTVSTPAQLSTPGWLELEAGGLRTRGPDAGESRTTLPYALKLAFTPDWGVFVAGDAWVRQVDGPGLPAASGGGDTTLVLKHRIPVDDATAWGLELGEKLPTAGAVLGSGRADTTVNGIFSSDFAPAWHIDLNLNETRLGVPAGAPRAWETGWAVSTSHSLTDRWGATSELSGTHQTDAPDASQILFAGTFNASNAVVFDFGCALGLAKAAPHNQIFAGVTLRLGRLF